MNDLQRILAMLSGFVAARATQHPDDARARCVTYADVLDVLESVRVTAPSRPDRPDTTAAA
jgi:hypothetical protein